MREIKFRAWDNIDKRMITVNGMIATKLGAVVSENTLEDDMVYISDYELMQYTGLEDKNGKEIYEGDIVAIEMYNNVSDKWDKIHNGEVKYCEDRFLATYGDTGRCSLSFLPTHIEVIGNIYENPELIE